MQRRTSHLAIALAVVAFIFLLSGGQVTRLEGALLRSVGTGDLSILDGAAIDDQNGGLILFGRDAPSLPALDRSDLTVALRTRFDLAASSLDRWPGVTIEFSSTNQAVLDVTYFGPVHDTHFGYVLFESDRLLKYYGLGYDNSSGVAEPITSDVSGYQSELACLEEQGYAPGAGQLIQWRKWFSPTVTVEVAEDDSAMVFTQSRIMLNWTYDSQATDPLVSECVQRFVDHFNQHYDQFADEQQARGNPVLHELVQYGRLVAIAEWLYDRDLSRRVPGLNPAWLNGLPVTSHATPLTTPRIAVGAGSLIQSGGVDLRVAQDSYQTVPETPALAAAVLASREGADVTDWYTTVEQLPCPGGLPNPGPASCPLPIHATLLNNGRFAQYDAAEHLGEGTTAFFYIGGPLGEPYTIVNGDAVLRYTFPADELANTPIRAYYQSARLAAQAESQVFAESHTGQLPTAAVNQLKVRLIPANGQPVEVQTFTGQDQEGFWVPGPYLDLTPYANQDLTIEVEISIVPGSRVLFAFGALQVVTAPSEQQPSPTPVTPTPIPERYHVYMPVLLQR